MTYNLGDYLFLIGLWFGLWVLALCLADWIGQYLLGEAFKEENDDA